MKRIILYSIIKLILIVGCGTETTPGVIEKERFYLADNGITIKCERADFGDFDFIDGVLYEAVDRSLLEKRIEEGADLSRLCTSRIRDMSYYFFAQQISISPLGIGI
jgi:hypothetical protein